MYLDNNITTAFLTPRNNHQGWPPVPSTPTRQLEAAPADVEETSEALVACEVGNMSLKNTIFATYKILESQGIFFCWQIFF